MFGLLNINKPAGLTSRDVVNHVQRIVRPEKAGHAGTLDPLATGVLIVCIGQATRLIEYVQRMPKRYTGTFLLGRESDTEDVEGQVIELVNPPQPTRSDIDSALPALIGEIQQMPPTYSALKVQGQRAYKLARQGKPVQLEPRTISVHDIRLLKYDYPELTLDITCGSGTYVRSLGRDLAASLGTAAVMSALVRTAIGSFSLGDACRLDQLSHETIRQHLLSASQAVSVLPCVQLTHDEIERIAHGLAIDDRFHLDAVEFAAEDDAGTLLAILVPRQPQQLGPSRVFGKQQQS
jgi:tRNA pseudouridine55 synthase